MADIQSLIEMLQSDNTNEPRAACKELSISPSLPQEALQALRVATNDKNPSVAEAAQQALAAHAEKKELGLNDQTKIELPMTDSDAIKLGIKIGLIPFGLFFVIGSLSTSDLFLGVYIALSLGIFFGVPGGIIGALIGKYSKNTRNAAQAGALLGTLLGIGLWLLLFGFGIY